MKPPGAGASDEELVRRIQVDPCGAGGDAAAATLFGRHQKRVYLWCFGYVQDHERALDLAQDVLISAWRALPRYDARAPFACWLYVIARNRCFSAMRPVSLTRDEEADLEAVVDGHPDPEREFQERQEEGLVMELLTHTLDRREQDVLYLRCWERLPIDEITRQLAIGGASGARGVLQTARRKLRAALEQGRRGRVGRV